jgi:hypothetical protein
MRYPEESHIVARRLLLRPRIKGRESATVKTPRKHDLKGTRREILLNVGLLREIPYLVGTKPVGVFDLTRNRAVEPKQGLDKSALARAVFTYDDKIVTVIYRKGNIFNDTPRIITQNKRIASNK